MQSAEQDQSFRNAPITREEFESRLFGASPDGFVTVNATGTMVLANRRMAELFGYELKELEGTSVGLLIPPQHREELMARWQAYHERSRFTHEPSSLEMQGYHCDGTEFPIELTLTPFSVRGHWLTLAAVRDQSALRRAQRENERHREALAGLAEIASTLTSGPSFEHAIRRVLDRLVGVLGASSASYYEGATPQDLQLVNMVGHPVLREAMMALPKIKRRTPKAMRSALETDAPVVLNHYGVGERRNTLLAKAGARALASVPVRSSSGIVGAMSVTSFKEGHFDDAKVDLLSVTASIIGSLVKQTHTLDAEKRRADELTVLYEISSVLSQPGSVESNAQKAVEVLLHSIGADRLRLRLKEADGTMRVMGDAISDQERLDRGAPTQKGNDTSAEAIRSGRTVRSDHFPNSGRPGDHLAMPVQSDTEIIGVLTLGSFQPGFFTEEKIALAEATATALGALWESAKLREELAIEESIGQQRDAFIATASHELRTPLSALVAFSELLLINEPPAEQRRQWYQRMASEGNRLTAIVSDLLDVGKLQAGKLTLQTIPVDVGNVIEQAIGSLSVALKERSVTTAGDGHLPPIYGDPVRLRQVLTNLIENAAKFSENDQVIEITTALTSAETIRISVTDHGRGIAQDDQVRLFHPFGRVFHDRTSSRGTGMGLFIVKGLVERMGGSVALESTLGEGSTFHVDLPVMTADRLANDNESVEERIQG